MTEQEQLNELRDRETMRLLKYYSYICVCTTEITKYQVIRGVALHFEQARIILELWNKKNESEGKPKLECIAILEGDYARESNGSMIVPSKFTNFKKSKYSREELLRYYKHICEVLNI